MWAYPDGLKIYDNRFKVINDTEPEYSFGEHHKVGVFGDKNSRSEGPQDYVYSFVHTDYGLNRTYYSALCWHVPQSINRKRYMCP